MTTLTNSIAALEAEAARLETHAAFIRNTVAQLREAVGAPANGAPTNGNGHTQNGNGHVRLTTAEVARRLGLSEPRIHQLINDGTLSSKRETSGWRRHLISESSVAALEAARGS